MSLPCVTSQRLRTFSTRSFTRILITQQGVFDALRVGLNGDEARLFSLSAPVFNLLGAYIARYSGFLMG